MQKDPFWSVNNIGKGPFPVWSGPYGVKADGGGSVRGCGRVGPMKIHRAVNNKNLDLITSLVTEDPLCINEVEATGMTPLHYAAWSGFKDGVDLLLSLGAKIDATSNSGESAWSLAKIMDHTEICSLLESKGAKKELGPILVPDCVMKVKDFYKKECWKHHPLPYADFVDSKRKEQAEMESQSKKAVH